MNHWCSSNRAAKDAREPVVRLLLEANADLLSQNIAGQTALDVAKSLKKREFGFAPLPPFVRNV